MSPKSEKKQNTKLNEIEMTTNGEFFENHVMSASPSPAMLLSDNNNKKGSTNQPPEDGEDTEEAKVDMELQKEEKV